LRACGGITGLERLRFTSPHPAAFTDDVIAAMAETPNVMPSLHMPLQSGSDRVLRAMRRSYRTERYLGIIERVRAALPDAAITTDIIVGFPGETEEDFAATLEVVRAARFASAFTFQYSPRPGTPAAAMSGQVPKSVVQQRYERLVAVQEEIAWAENRRQVGRTLDLLVATGEGRKDAATDRLSGRAPDNRLVHFAVPPHGDQPRPGDVVTVQVTYGAPHHLVADAALSDGPYAVRRTRAGDAWEARERSDTVETGPGRPAVGLGLPTVRRAAG
jgi:tRNA-2-methylthio-N6-dimethylallyladenosine synthase